MDNPYESPTLESKKAGFALPRPRLIDCFPWVVIVTVSFAIHLNWIMAWNSLGHRPNSGIDNPTKISGFGYEASYAFLDFLCKFSPLAIVVAMLAQLILGGFAFRYRLAYVGITVLGIVLLLLTLVWDPFRAWHWFLGR